MKRLITSLSVLFLFVAARADGFGPNDKVLYFNSETLIAVIKDTFPQNLQLDVANKYVELMDKSGNVSIADLIAVCGVGQLDNAKCKNFIRDLINTMGDDTIKPFYWADYVSANPEPIRLAVYSSGDGYHKNAGLDSGEWAITFGWMRESKFMQQYPQTKYIRGISACTNESGQQNVADMSKNFALNEQSGEHCWCKMTGPEESPWVYNKSGDTMAGGCERSCALECLSALRNEPMRAAMFSVVKLNGSNANTNDEKVIGDALVDEFKPCEFDWANDISPFNYYDEGYLLTPLDNELYAGYYGRGDTYGLNYEEWGMKFDFMKSEKFQCKYPGVTKIKGIAKFESCDPNYDEQGRLYIGWCYCRVIYPEKSKWVKLGIPFHDVGDTTESTLNIKNPIKTATQGCLEYCYWYGGMYWYDMLKSIGKK